MPHTQGGPEVERPEPLDGAAVGLGQAHRIRRLSALSLQGPQAEAASEGCAGGVPRQGSPHMRSAANADDLWGLDNGAPLAEAQGMVPPDEPVLRSPEHKRMSSGGGPTTGRRSCDMHAGHAARHAHACAVSRSGAGRCTVRGGGPGASSLPPLHPHGHMADGGGGESQAVLLQLHAEHTASLVERRADTGAAGEGVRFGSAAEGSDGAAGGCPPGPASAPLCIARRDDLAASVECEGGMPAGASSGQFADAAEAVLGPQDVAAGGPGWAPGEPRVEVDVAREGSVDSLCMLTSADTPPGPGESDGHRALYQQLVHGVQVRSRCA